MKKELVCLLVLVFAATIALGLDVGPSNVPGDGSTAVVDVFPNGVMRLRLRPKVDKYEVTDVIVAKTVQDSEVKKTCDGQRCTVEYGTSRLVVDLELGEAEFYNDGTLVTKLQAMSEGSDRISGTIRFPLAKRLYGIPEHAVDLALERGKTYRLYNLDVFKYKLDDTGGIYGTIPFLMAHGPTHSTGVLWLNSADSNVEILADQAQPGEAVTWSSESGVHDVLFFPGGTPEKLQREHSFITGPVYLPPLFALGYHQCRWNYRSTADALDVDHGFDVHNIPYDVLWLDIEHTDGKKYFTWDSYNFPDPKKMIDSVAAKGRKMVTITDPHIKREGGYHVHDEATANGYYVKSEGGGDYEGDCWPGRSSWVDFYNPKARDWYATMFLYDKYKGSTPELYTWIDMNEPSVFNSHEVTMDKNAVHTSGDGKQVKHRDLHNMYGFYNTIATWDGHMLRSSKPPHDKQTRPFILTRSFFSGSQRYAAMWTGDNMAEWDHLAKSIPMVLTLSLANFPFAGADVGGFFDNPEPELLQRWYQMGVFYPFFRGHAHLETQRREPWLFGEEVTNRIRNAIALRYSLLPYYYTTFFEAHRKGLTMMRPLVYHFPSQEEYFSEQNTFMVGAAILARPVVAKGETSVSMALPAGEKWYSFPSGEVLPDVRQHSVSVTLDTIPMALRGGFVVPTRQRLRRSTAAMYYDPVTLYVAADANGNAVGHLYLDDTHSFEYNEGKFVYREFRLLEKVLTSRISQDLFPTSQFQTKVSIERIVFFGLSFAPKAAVLKYDGSSGPQGIQVQQTLDVIEGVNGVYTVRKPDALVAADWTISLE